MKIGVFDSGVGGESVAAAIKQALPDHEVIFRNDAQHMPYGLRSAAELEALVVPIFEQMIKEGCKVIVIACNTVSTSIVSKLRERFTVPFVALEPMVKPAASLTKSQVIGVCATPTTLASDRYSQLKEQYAKHVKVLEPDCSDWAYLIEHKRTDELKLQERIDEVLDQGADVLVLACTHYHWIEQEIQKLAQGRAVVLQPEVPLVSRLRQVLAQLA